MFGKSKKSSNDRFVMAAGRAAGNLKGVKPFGNKRGPAGDSGKATPDPFSPRTLKVGKNSRFSAQ